MTIDLDCAEALEVERCGGKAATLARIRQEGISTPPGFILPADEVDGWPEDTAAIACDVSATIRRAWGDVPVAVRSSAMGEDGKDASFAGLFTTVLGVQGVEALASALRQCRDSAREAPVLVYRGGLPPRLAILVQPLLNPVAAGVAFTADPVTGDRDVVRVSAVAGLGDRLVAGEATPDEWDIRAGNAVRRDDAGDSAIEAQVALSVAHVAEVVANHLGGPQDVEWVWDGNDVIVVQARPITALPTPPEPLPGEGWSKDLAHYPEPITPFGGDVYLRMFDPVFAETCDHFGLMIDGMESRVVGGEVYSRTRPHSTGSPPPAPILGIAVRVVPAFRRKMRAARRIADERGLEDYPRMWNEQWRDEMVATNDRFRNVDVASLDDAALVAHGDAIETHMATGGKIHFRLMIPYFVSLYEWHTVTSDLLGWGAGDAMAALAGRSPASSAGGRDLADLRRRMDDVPGAREAMERSPGDPESALREINPSLADAFVVWIAEHGQRTASFDAGSPTLSERPGLVARLLLTGSDTGIEDNDMIDAARRRLSESDRMRFDKALAFALTCYPLREDNVVLIDNIPCGLMRRWMLEVGRRLVQRGHLDRVEDAAWCFGGDLRAALTGEPADLRNVVVRHRGEWAWVRAHPGPDQVGPGEGPTPDISWLPAASRRINQAVLWAMDHEFGTVPNRGLDGDVIRGAPGSPGTYRGPVRVIRGEADFVRLAPGDVLVCPVTTPAWAMLFPLAGALVTDGGGVLSHAAIVAREHGIPAVLGTGDATRALRDGQVVEVDGVRGMVTLVA